MVKRRFAFAGIKIPWILLAGLLFALTFSQSVRCQELEPRALTNVPLGMNFVLLGYSYSRGDLLLDPAIPIEDLDGTIHTIAGAYLRSIKIFGLAGKVDVVLPWASGDWTGKLAGIDSFRSVSGTGDARIRLSVNFVGAPPLIKQKFRDYKPSKISGASLQIFAPTGQYDPDRLINLGSNRWVFKPQWGFARYLRNWIIETYLSAYFFTTNSDFYGGHELKQKPLGAIKLHGIRSFPKGWWIALDAGYGLGGTTYLDGEKKDTRISTFRFGMTFAVPIGQHHVLRLTGVTGVRLERGSDFDAVALTYQYRWIK